MSETNPINPFIRAEQYMYSDETRELLTPPHQADYVRIISRLAIANTAYQEAYLEREAAHAEHHEFMTRMASNGG